MKRRHILLINLVFLGLVLFSSGVVYQFMTGNKPLSFFKDLQTRNQTIAVETEKCSDKKTVNLGAATSPTLIKLAVYQHACRSFVSDTSMVFTSMPTTQEQAVAYAKADAVVLKDYAKHNIRPLVIIEPSTQAGDQLDYGLIAQGTYSGAFDTYFAQLKQEGITDAQLGIWNPFPEANLPYWKNNKPEYFAPSVNGYVSTLRKHFPHATTSILLNSATYEATDFNWENGDYSSLLPYVANVTPGTIDYAGLQGFPWMARAGGSGVILNAAEFLNPDLLTEMADKLGTKKVWFNTGSFQTKYALDPDLTVHMTPERRKAVLTPVVGQALLLKEKGYDVSVNIFAKDKSKTSEETDWSYWHGSDPFSSQSTPVITGFIKQLHDEKINFWLFDN